MKPPTTKTTSRFVSRILDRTATPIYVIGNDYVVTYANEACSQWVGIELEQLIGAKCVFASQSHNESNDELNQRLQGLCPPPTFFETDASAQHTPEVSRSPEGGLSNTNDSNAADSRCLVSTIDQNKKTVWRPPPRCAAPLATKIRLI